MTAQSLPANPIISEFTTVKQTKLFQSLQQRQITGQLTFTNPKQGHQWHFYLDLGQIIYATGGVHPLRRWQRNLSIHLPEIPFDLVSVQQELRSDLLDWQSSLWQYQKLCLWLEQQKITREQANNLIWSTVVEILFDLTQGMEIICSLKKDDSLQPQLDLVAPEAVIEKTQLLWQEWQNSKVADRSPNFAPIIVQPQQLQKQISARVYPNLSKLLDGNHSLRDLAISLKTSPLQITRSLLPYVQSGLISLVEIPDLLESSNEIPQPLIACIDDSPMTAYLMEKVVSMAGYRFISVNDPLKAIAILLESKPDLIFLDVIMPNINGYQLCSQLREHPTFQDTPIIFLTSNDGLFDRFKAKMSGASGFLSKTIDADKLLDAIANQLAAKSVH
jgi:chemotaxis family two-component system response regulator PixG